MTKTKRTRQHNPGKVMPSQNFEGMTLSEVGEAFDVTRERIRQIEVKSLRLLRARLRAKGIRKMEDLL